MKIIKLIESIINEVLTENINFKELERENKFTLPKINSNNIFLNDREIIKREDRSEADKLIDNNTYNNLPNLNVNVKDIVPSQRSLNINNLKKVKNTTKDTDSFLLKINDKYYILDGHHRIAVNILKGNNNISAYVFDESKTF